MSVSTETVRLQPYRAYQVTSDSLRAFVRQQAHVLDPGWGSPLDLGLPMEAWPRAAGIWISPICEGKPDTATIGWKLVTIGLPDDCGLMLECNVGPDPPYLELTVSGPDAAVAAVIAAFRQTFAGKVPFPRQISVHTALDFEATPQIGIARWGSKYR